MGQMTFGHLAKLHPEAKLRVACLPWILLEEAVAKEVARCLMKLIQGSTRRQVRQLPMHSSRQHMTARSLL
ncbi:MAG: hypothetical protein EB075_13705 [Bacteroidetes bacterium]|nr:hypothetical protein [Bacteroidota bacterium]